MNVGKDSSLGDDDLAEQSVELLVVSDRELQVSRNDSGFLVVPRSIACELEDLSREVPTCSMISDWVRNAEQRETYSRTAAR